MASTLPAWLSSHPSRASGAIRSTISCPARLRQRSSLRSQSHTTTSAPRSDNSATRLEPMNPAPPVTTYMLLPLLRAAARLCYGSLEEPRRLQQVADHVIGRRRPAVTRPTGRGDQHG